jgi:hypothetical protein
VQKREIGTPELRNRLLAPCVVRGRDNTAIGVHLGALVRRVLLFEQYVIKSAALWEFPFLVEALGEKGLVQLLSSGAVKVAPDEWVIGDVGQSDVRKRTDTRDKLPLGSFDFRPIAAVPESADDPNVHPGKIRVFREMRRERFAELKAALPVVGKANMRVRGAIADALVEWPEGPLGDPVFDSLERDVTGHQALVQQAVIVAASEQGVVPSQGSIIASMKWRSTEQSAVFAAANSPSWKRSSPCLKSSLIQMLRRNASTVL